MLGSLHLSPCRPFPILGPKRAATLMQATRRRAHPPGLRAALQVLDLNKAWMEGSGFSHADPEPAQIIWGRAWHVLRGRHEGKGGPWEPYGPHSPLGFFCVSFSASVPDTASILPTSQMRKKRPRECKNWTQIHSNRIQCAASGNIASRHPHPLFFFSDLLRQGLTRQP